jgi:hypothetical protein
MALKAAQTRASRPRATSHREALGFGGFLFPSKGQGFAVFSTMAFGFWFLVLVLVFLIIFVLRTSARSRDRPGRATGARSGSGRRIESKAVLGWKAALKLSDLDPLPLQHARRLLAAPAPIDIYTTHSLLNPNLLLRCYI